MVPPRQPGAAAAPPVNQDSRGGLSRGAIAGITGAGAVVAVGILVAACSGKFGNRQHR